jgi:hypothetical protein
MAKNEGKHFYLFEPVQLKSGEIFVPIFFCMENHILRSKCVAPQFLPHACLGSGSLQIPGGLAFDSDLMVPINVDQFDLIYSEINMGSDGRLKTMCSNQIWGQLPFPFPRECVLMMPKEH